MLAGIFNGQKYGPFVYRRLIFLITRNEIGSATETVCATNQYADYHLIYHKDKIHAKFNNRSSNLFNNRGLIKHY